MQTVFWKDRREIFNTHVLFYVLATYFTISKGLEYEGFRFTEYGCQGNKLSISCGNETFIKIIRANYGRFSISICNNVGHTSWSVNCMQPRSMRVIKTRCEGKFSCQFPVSNALFGDPCPNTPKYVEVHYNCVNVKEKLATTHSPLPPWELDLIAKPSSEKSSTEATITSLQTTKVTFNSPRENNDATIFFLSGQNSSADSSDETKTAKKIFLHNHCPPLTLRNIFWNWTYIGKIATNSCPPGSSGVAKWLCKSDATWDSLSPDLGDCQSNWLTRLESHFHTDGLSDSYSKELLSKTKTKTLYGGDIFIITRLIQALLHKFEQELYHVQSQAKKQRKASYLMESVVKILSNLLSYYQIFAWRDLLNEKLASCITAFLIGLEENAVMMAEIMKYDTNVSISSKNIIVFIKHFHIEDLNGKALLNTSEFHWEQDVSFALLKDFPNTLSNPESWNVILFFYNNLERIMPSLGKNIVNSKVIGLNMIGEIPAQFSIMIILKHLHEIEWKRTNNSACVSWDYLKQKWSMNECQTLSTNSSHTFCKCFKHSVYAVLSNQEYLNIGSVSLEDKSEQPGTVNFNAEQFNAIIFVIIISFSFLLFIVLIFFSLIFCPNLRKRFLKVIQGNEKHTQRSKEMTCEIYSHQSCFKSSTSTSVSNVTNSELFQNSLKDSCRYDPEVYLEDSCIDFTGQGEDSKNIKLNFFKTTPNCSHVNLDSHIVSNNQNHIYMEIDPSSTCLYFNDEHLPQCKPNF